MIVSGIVLLAAVFALDPEHPELAAPLPGSEHLHETLWLYRMDVVRREELRTKIGDAEFRKMVNEQTDQLQRAGKREAAKKTRRISEDM